MILHIRLFAIVWVLSLQAPIAGKSNAPDTLRLSLPGVDSLFLKNNLMLLAQLYNIEARDALIIQAKAYPNPTFTMDLNAIDPENEKYFHVGKDGQKEFALEQLLIIGGKRRSMISLARQDKSLAENELAELLRNLRQQLHINFYQIHQHQTILSNFDRQLELLNVIIQAYDEQARKGNIPLKDVIRLKAVYLRISNNRLDVRALQLENVQNLQILLQLSAMVVPQLGEHVFTDFQTPHTYEELLDLAMQNRPDLQAASLGIERAKTSLQLQKQLAIPDVILHTAYDQRGGAFQNQVNVGLAIPLPIFNRNQGNIKAASYDKLNSEIYNKQKQNQVQAEVISAWEGMKHCIREYANASQLYTRDFGDVFTGVNENFQRRNISILEFVDFFEAYNESLADFQRIKTQLALAAEQINYVTASPVY